MISEDYDNILIAWDENISSSDIYHMILNWINTYKNEIAVREVLDSLEDILERMSNNYSTNDIVEDFIYGSKYETIKNYIKSSGQNMNSLSSVNSSL
jgi:hypothetical protein